MGRYDITMDINSGDDNIFWVDPRGGCPDEVDVREAAGILGDAEGEANKFKIKKFSAGGGLARAGTSEGSVLGLRYLHFTLK